LRPIRESIDALEDSLISQVWSLGRHDPEVIGLWAGEADLPTPRFISEAAIASLRAGDTFYSHGRGIVAMRAALSDYLERLYGRPVAEDRIALTSSGMNGVMLLAQALVGPGDSVVSVSPCWPNLLRALAIAGAEVRTVTLAPGEAGWTLDLDALFAACDATTRMICFASPGNPTGWVMERAAQEAVLGFARARGISVLADEVYHRLVYDRLVAPSMLEIAEPEDTVYVVNSFSKAWAMTGWRLGWITYPAGQAAAFEKLIQFNTSGAPTFLQAGAIAALRDGEPFVAELLDYCRAGRAIAESRLASMARVRAVPNSASFYSMFRVDGVADTLSFCKRLVVEGKVGTAPGEAFGPGAEGLTRLCYAKSPARLHEAMDRIAAFVAEYQE
jgi:aspartate aminotransferase